jgi:hypothetical protein
MINMKAIVKIKAKALSTPAERFDASENIALFLQGYLK